MAVVNTQLDVLTTLPAAYFASIMLGLQDIFVLFFRYTVQILEINPTLTFYITGFARGMKAIKTILVFVIFFYRLNFTTRLTDLCHPNILVTF